MENKTIFRSENKSEKKNYFWVTLGPIIIKINLNITHVFSYIHAFCTATND